MEQSAHRTDTLPRGKVHAPARAGALMALLTTRMPAQARPLLTVQHQWGET